MENATKALLIAAAILVAIIIISIGIAVVNKGQEAVGDADLTEAEVNAFNMKFKNYEGTNKTAADVNALLSAVVTHNQTAATTGEPVVTLSGAGGNTLNGSSTSYTKVSGSTRYTVTCTYAAGGRITSITVSP